MDGLTFIWMDPLMDGLTDRWMDPLMDGLAGGVTD